MAEEAQSLLSANGADNAAVVTAPIAVGAAKHGPYDAIIIEGAIEALPSDISSQLKNGGRIVAIFAEGTLGTVRIGHKRGDVINWQYAFNAAAPVIEGFEAKQEFAL